MKLIISLFVFAASTTAFAEKMGPQAIEVFRLMSHPDVQECLKDVPYELVNTSIEKTVRSCPGCVDYKISGNRVEVDVVQPQKTVVTIKGKAVPGFAFGYVQTYSCLK